MKHAYEEKYTLREACGATSRFIGRCIGAVALVMAMLLLVSCGGNSALPEESSAADEQVETPTDSTTTTTTVDETEPPVTYAGPTVWVGSASAKAGETVDVTLYIENNPGIMAFDFGFEYDTERLLLVEATVLPEFGEDSEYDCHLVWVGNQDTTYDGAFAKLTFQVLANATPGDATVEVVCDDVGDVCNYDEEDIVLSFVGGTITVTA